MTKNVALVLSSGGCRGLAHIGAIEALLDHDYNITAVAGCSIGAIVGGMYAAGKLPELKEWFLDMNRLRMFQLTDLSVSINHLVKGDKVMEAFGEMIPEYCIENLPIPLAIIATDMITGTEQVFTSGNLNQIIRASMSVPVVFKPVRYGDMLLVDGGVTNPLPLNRIQRNEGDLLVSVNVSAPFEASVGTSGEQETNIPKLVAAMLEKGKQLTKLNYVSIMSRITSIMIVQNAELMTQMYHPDMSVLMAKNHYGSYEYDRADEIIACGYDMMINEIHRYESSYPFG